MLEAGEGRVEITPPLGIELAGFHKPKGQERVVTGIRQRAEARALFLRQGGTTAVILSLDLCGVPPEFAQRVQKRAARACRVPGANVRVCVTHTHSMPTLRFFRQWGEVSPAYMRRVEDCALQAIELAKTDLAPADLYVGQERVVGGNFNRTAKTWKTDAEFTRDSTDQERWLDTTLHVLHWLRERPKTNLTWYHFSAHPVCFGDGMAGPDWPGLVAQKLQERDGLSCSYLQGHIGDVNPGNGTPWTGDAEKVSEAVYTALHHAVNHSDHRAVSKMRVRTGAAEISFDLARWNDQLARYRSNPEQCNQGEWVDAGFARDWYESASKRRAARTLRSPISVLQLGDVGLLFHAAELYSFYGLKVRLDSPFAATLLVGYADDFIGYLTDPKAYEASEYAAIVVPKILDLPPFKPEAARQYSDALLQLARKI